MRPYFFFDQGEVILTNDWDFDCPEKDEQFFSIYQVKPNKLLKARKALVDNLFRGQVTEIDYWTEVLKLVHAKELDPRPAIDLARKYQAWKPGMKSLIHKYNHMGIQMGVITTTHKEMWQFKLNQFALNKLFKPIVTSFETGFVKPEKEAYLLALEKAEVEPAETIFIDDSEINVQAARKLGIKAIRFVSADSLEEQLDKHLK